MSLDAAGLRRLALALPEVVEQDHHGFPSFRVRGRIFATYPDHGELRVMLAAGDVPEAVAANPGVCTELWWGKRLSGVRVELAAADEATVRELLTDAWRAKAPRSLASG